MLLVSQNRTHCLWRPLPFLSLNASTFLALSTAPAYRSLHHWIPLNAYRSLHWMHQRRSCKMLRADSALKNLTQGGVVAIAIKLRLRSLKYRFVKCHQFTNVMLITLNILKWSEPEPCNHKVETELVPLWPSFCSNGCWLATDLVPSCLPKTCSSMHA